MHRGVCHGQHSTAQHSTAQHSTAQHSIAQHSTAQAYNQITSNNQLDANAISRIAQGNWSHLGCLSLGWNMLDIACMQQLAHGLHSTIWPLSMHALMHLLYIALLKALGLHCEF